MASCAVSVPKGGCWGRGGTHWEGGGGVEVQDKGPRFKQEPQLVSQYSPWNGKDRTQANANFKENTKWLK